MLPFSGRFFLISFIWMIIFASFSMYKHTSVVFLLLFCSISLAIYFLFPIAKRKGLVSASLIGITFIYLFLSKGVLFYPFSLLIVYYLLEYAFFLQNGLYRVILLTSNVLLMFSYIWFFDFQVTTFLIVFTLLVMIHLSLWYLNSTLLKNHTQSDLYEQILDEYRKVKRQALHNVKTARLEERTRIAREMHDSVGHKLTALGMQIEMMLMKEDSKMMQNMKETVNDCLEETRKAVRALQLDHMEGVSSVIHLIRKLESESHLQVHFTTKQGVLGLSLSNQSSIVLYRVLQESLTNAMKYSESREVFVILGISPIGQLAFEIRNSLHKHTPFHEGFGLRNMKQRIEEIQGKIEIYHTEQEFVIEGMIPVEE